MAVKIIFQGSEESTTHYNELECCECDDKIFISIRDTDCHHDYGIQIIHLDKPTAIKLSRELRKQIALIQ